MRIMRGFNVNLALERMNADFGPIKAAWAYVELIGP